MYNRDRWLQVTIIQLLWLLQTRTHYTQWLYWWLFYIPSYSNLSAKLSNKLHLVACNLFAKPSNTFILLPRFATDQIPSSNKSGFAIFDWKHLRQYSCIFIWFSNLFSCLSFYGIFWRRSQLTYIALYTNTACLKWEIETNLPQVTL